MILKWFSIQIWIQFEFENVLFLTPSGFWPWPEISDWRSKDKTKNGLCNSTFFISKNLKNLSKKHPPTIFIETICKIRRRKTYWNRKMTQWRKQNFLEGEVKSRKGVLRLHKEGYQASKRRRLSLWDKRFNQKRWVLEQPENPPPPHFSPLSPSLPLLSPATLLMIAMWNFFEEDKSCKNFLWMSKKINEVWPKSLRKISPNEP